LFLTTIVRDANRKVVFDDDASFKISFGSDVLENVVAISPSESRGWTFPLKNILRYSEPGEYSVAVRYRNQYGEGCFRTIELLSNEFVVTIGE
jgi:hypothetical protein